MSQELKHEACIAEKLNIIQTRIKVPKNKYNSFGKYSYRNLESIFESLKPLLDELACYVTIDNEMVVVGDKIFRKSIARIGCCVTGEEMSTVNYTQEAFQKAGMSPEQCSGSAGSYGDKYALSRLLLLDDTNDPDDTSVFQQGGVNESPGDYVCIVGKKYNGKKIKDIPEKELVDYCKYLTKDNKDLTGPMKSFVDNAREFLKAKK